jgi:hypothetical protein
MLALMLLACIKIGTGAGCLQRALQRHLLSHLVIDGSQVGDFGLALKMDHMETHISSVFQGTMTHMAPEIMMEVRTACGFFCARLFCDLGLSC